jgi:hypothetical protein
VLGRAAWSRARPLANGLVAPGERDPCPLGHPVLTIAAGPFSFSVVDFRATWNWLGASHMRVGVGIEPLAFSCASRASVDEPRQ